MDAALCTLRKAAITTATMLSATRARQKPNKAALGSPHVFISAWQYASRCWKAVSSVQRLRYNRATRLAEAVRRGTLVRMYSPRSPSRVA